MRFRILTMRVLFITLAVFAVPVLVAAQKSGYVWANEPASASYIPSSTFSFNSSGGAISITRSGVGAYAVRFSGLGDVSAGGNVLVTAYGADSGTCKVSSWSSAGADFVVNVRCYNHLGIAVNSMYTVRVVRNSPAPAFTKSGYAWANNSTIASYAPSTVFSFNSSGGAISITRSGVGTYNVRFSGLGSAATGGNVLVTAYGGVSETCKVVNWNAAGADFVVNVRCFSSTGASADSQYSINVVR